MFFLKLQLVCIWDPVAKREVCPRLLQSVLSIRNSTQCNTCEIYCQRCVIAYTPSFVLHRNHTSNVQRLPHDTNTKISYRKVTIKEFGWRMNWCVLWRATRIRAFPKNAVMDKQVLTTERKMSSPSTSPVNSAEQKNSTAVCRFSPPVKFFISMTFLRFGYSQLNSFFNTSVLLIWQSTILLVLPLCCRAIREQITQLAGF